MSSFRFWNKIIGLTLGKLCQQRWLLAGLALLCFLLPAAMAPAAEAALSRGLGFSGITLAITGPEGDPVPGQLAQLLPNMSDVSQYCRVEAMEYDDALESLERAEVTAVLVLPEHFVQGVMNGSNPDVELIVRGDRPLEALLTLWVGQSASDLLAAAQSGIYAVLELYGENPPADLSYQEAMTKINLRYISRTMNRQEMFRTETISITDQLPVGLHYGLSLLVFLVLSMAPFFAPVFTGQWIAARRRFRAAGRGTWMFYGSTLASVWIILFTVLTAAQLMICGGSFWRCACMGALCGFFCAAFAAVCCLLTADTGGCGVLAFSGSLVLLALSGGILPPVLMPRGLREWMGYSPVTWLRSALSGQEVQPGMMAALVLSALAMTAVGGLLYRRRGEGKGESL